MTAMPLRPPSATARGADWCRNDMAANAQSVTGRAVAEGRGGEGRCLNAPLCAHSCLAVAAAGGAGRAGRWSRRTGLDWTGLDWTGWSQRGVTQRGGHSGASAIRPSLSSSIQSPLVAHRPCALEHRCRGWMGQLQRRRGRRTSHAAAGQADAQPSQCAPNERTAQIPAGCRRRKKTARICSTHDSKAWTNKQKTKGTSVTQAERRKLRRNRQRLQPMLLCISRINHTTKKPINTTTQLLALCSCVCLLSCGVHWRCSRKRQRQRIIIF